MKIVKDGEIIEATERAYEIVYKYRGYKPYKPKPTKKEKPDE